SAARTCSAVETSGPDASPSTVANSVAVTEVMSAEISQSCRPSMPVRIKRRPVPASAGCSASVTGKPEWTPTPDKAVWSHSVVCLATFILPSHTLPAAVMPIAHYYRPHATIMRATPDAVLPSVRLYKPAGKDSAALSPDEIPFDQESLAVAGAKANSRFF